MSAVVVEYNSGEALMSCVKSLEEQGVEEIIIIDNSPGGPAPGGRAAHGPAGPGPSVRTVRPGRNLGYGGGANLGVAETNSEYVLICNPDLVLAPGAVQTLAMVLKQDRDAAVAGPLLRETSGLVFPSGREFPSIGEALGHAFLGLFWAGNPWTRRYRRIGADQHVPREADWVSGAAFLVRRSAFESVGGFDEGYFMYLEEVDLCWRLKRAGWKIRYEPGAEAIHEQGRSTSQHPYRMLAAHHRSMWRFAEKSSSGRERLLLPVIGIGLGLRLALAWLEHLAQPRRRLGLESRRPSDEEANRAGHGSRLK